MFVRSKIIRSALFCFILAGPAISGVSCKKTTGSTYNYTIPQKTNDGWETASLDAENIDRVLIGKLAERIQDQSYKNIHSLLLVKNGKLVLEEYFPGPDSNGEFRHYDRNRIHEMASVTKSVSSILVGIAIDQHLIRGTDEKVSALFPEYADVFADHKRDDLQLKHLLTMTAGLAWNEWTHPYSDPRNDWVALHQSKDGARYVLTHSVKASPGSTFLYSGGLSFVLGEGCAPPFRDGNRRICQTIFVRTARHHKVLLVEIP
jgi:CubicO group peptidase (beta-lactamase class C family)